MLLFRPSTKSSIAQDKRLATSLLLVTGFYLPHAVVVRLHAHLIDVIILTSQNGGLSAGVSAVAYPCQQEFIQDEAMDVARSTPQGTHYHANVINLLP